MCLGVPMQVIALDGFNARCEARGTTREVSLLMLQDEDLKVGDFVMIHLGYALKKMTEEDAREAWEIYDQILSATHP